MIQIKAASRIKNSSLLISLEKKLDDLKSTANSMKSQSSNPTVSLNYYKTLGKLEAVEAIIEFVKYNRSTDLNLL